MKRRIRRKRIIFKTASRLLRSKKSIIYHSILLLTSLLIIGCGFNNETTMPGNSKTINDMAASTQSVRDTYVMEEMILPHESIFYETVVNDILYYLNYLPSGQGTVPAEEAAVCSVEMMAGQTIPTETPFVMGADLIPGRIAAGGNGAFYLLSSRYEGTG